MIKSKIKYGIGGFCVALTVSILIVKGCGGNQMTVCPYQEMVDSIEQPVVFADANQIKKFQVYIDYYGLDLEGLDHHIFKFDCSGFEIVGQIFEPEQPSKDIVIAVHGYMNHVAQMKKLIVELTDQGFAVGVFDLPGHGLSSGQRGGIDSFDTYSKVLAKYINIIDERFTGKKHLIGFSTGGSAVIDYILCNGGGNKVDKVLLAAPLVHSYGWKASRFGYDLTSWILERIPNMYFKNSEDVEYIEFVRSDPLIVKEVPFGWLEKLYQWNEKIEDCPKSDKHIKMLQGTQDRTVDGEYNIMFLQKKFDNIDVVMIEGAMHELLNEQVKLRTEVFNEITRYFEN